MPDPAALWWARVGPEHGPDPAGGTTLLAVRSDDFPPGTTVQLPGGQRPSGWVLAVHEEHGRVRRVEVARPGAPLLWYVELPEPHERPAATTLVAFSDDRHPDGRVLTAEEGRRSGATSGQQVGALRWWPGTGLVHQLYVAPEHRRRGVGVTLVGAGYGVQVARGLPPLRDDGRRTDLGEQWSRALPPVVAGRLSPRTEHLPPM